MLENNYYSAKVAVIAIIDARLHPKGTDHYCGFSDKLEAR